MGTTYCNCSTPSNSNENMLSQEAKAKQTNCERRNSNDNNHTEDKVKQNKKMKLPSGGNTPLILHEVPIDDPTIHMSCNESRSSSSKQRHPSIQVTNTVAKLFNEAGNECDPSDYTKCDAMRRLVSSSKYDAAMLQTKKSEDCDEILTRFMNEVYNQKGALLIDDY
eukprot:734329_1